MSPLLLMDDDMSIQPTMYRCDKCDFSASSMVNWGHFHYLDGEKPLSLNRKLGWCNCCATLTPVEVLPSLDELTCSMQKHKIMLHEFGLAYDLLLLKRSWFSRLIGLKPKLLDTLINLNIDIKKLEGNIAQLKELLAYLSDRESSPRCLKCGSLEVYSLSSLRASEEDISLIQVFRHPQCGGVVKASESEIRFAMRLRECFYNKEGIKVDF